MSSLSVNSIKQRAVQGLLFNFLRGQRTKNRAKWSPPILGTFPWRIHKKTGQDRNLRKDFWNSSKVDFCFFFLLAAGHRVLQEKQESCGILVQTLPLMLWASSLVTTRYWTQQTHHCQHGAHQLPDDMSLGSHLCIRLQLHQKRRFH